MKSYGCRSMTAPLRRVLVRPPQPEDAARWREHGWRAEPDHAAAAAEHEALCLLLEEAGAEVVVAEGEPGNPDAIYVYDPCLVTDDGAVLLRPGKPERQGEPEALVVDLERAGVPVAGRQADGDGRGRRHRLARRGHAARGHGYRTDAAGIAGARAADRREVIVFDLPHWHGAGEVMHLMSLISPLDADLALVYPRLAPVRLLQLLAERGIRTVEVPDEEFETMGPNVLALGPRRALALEGNDETRRRLERAGVDVVTYRGDEISRKGDGGPTCLTRPLLRAV